MLNAGDMMKVMGAMNQFKANHPKVVSFFKSVLTNKIEEGTIIEITVTKPGQDPITTNMKVQQSDIELFESFANMR